MLRLNSISTVRRTGFSLAELVVSIGILLLMLSLAGQVMTISVKSTGQARALTEANQALRIFEQTIRADLAKVRRPSEGSEPSLLVIQGNPINAHWTNDQLEADVDRDAATGYPHARDPMRSDPLYPEALAFPRADLLMIVTPDKAAAVEVETAPGVIERIPLDGYKQVVYGHARLGEYVPGGAGLYDFQPNPEAFVDMPDPSPVPAERWHLARRTVSLASLAPPIIAGVQFLDAQGAPPVRLGDERFLSAEHGVLWNFDYFEQMRRLSNLASGGFAFGAFPAHWPDIMAYDVGGAPPQEPPFGRSLLDETPPPPWADRLAHYFLANCASFKVEWALDSSGPFVGNLLDWEKELLWIDPGNVGDIGVNGVNVGDNRDDDPLAALWAAKTEAAESAAAGLGTFRDDSLGRLLRDDFRGAHGAQLYPLVARFGAFNAPVAGGGLPASEWRLGVPVGDGYRANLMVFTGPLVDASDDPVPSNVFPRLLRITVELYDRARRLDRPIHHVMIIPIGEGI